MTVQDVALQVNQPATVDVVFAKVEAVAESSTAWTESAQVSKPDASIGNAITRQAIAQLPLFARNVAGLLSLQPGAGPSGNVTGRKSDQGNVTLDGIDVNEQQDKSAFTSVIRVTPDSVQEFRTATINANADQRRSSGAQVALLTRGGTKFYRF